MITKKCKKCEKNFEAQNESAKYCINCRYSKDLIRERNHRTNPLYSSAAFLRLFDRWNNKLSKSEKAYILEQLSNYHED